MWGHPNKKYVFSWAPGWVVFADWDFVFVFAKEFFSPFNNALEKKKKKKRKKKGGGGKERGKKWKIDFAAPWLDTI